MYRKLTAMFMLFALLFTLCACSNSSEWTCPSCNTKNTGNFCSECGTAKPQEQTGEWTCPRCSAKNTVKYCTVCGTAKPGTIEAEVGSYITFGKYPQGANGEIEPIEWLVLDVQDGRALLLSRYGLNAQPYNTERTDVTWETCTLRTWLNYNFLNTAFTAEEQKCILLTNVDNSAVQCYFDLSTTGGNDTQDKIFLLSCKEANKYLGITLDSSGNRVQPTAYALSCGAKTYDRNKTADGAAAGWWWLRSPGLDQKSASSVDTDGSFYFNGNVVLSTASVRPAFWLDLES